MSTYPSIFRTSSPGWLKSVNLNVFLVLGDRSRQNNCTRKKKKGPFSCQKLTWRPTDGNSLNCLLLPCVHPFMFCFAVCVVVIKQEIILKYVFLCHKKTMLFVHPGSVISVQAHHLLEVTVRMQRTQQIFCSKVCRIYSNSTIIKKKQQLQNYVQVYFFF